jgi:hypothetical protein
VVEGSAHRGVRVFASAISGYDERLAGHSQLNPDAKLSTVGLVTVRRVDRDLTRGQLRAEPFELLRVDAHGFFDRRTRFHVAQRDSERAIHERVPKQGRCPERELLDS